MTGLVTGSYEYQPGSAHLAVSSRCGVLTSDGVLAARLWPLVVRGTALSGLLEEALRDGLAQLPDLVMFELDAGALRVIVRGKITVRVRSVAGDGAEFDGQSVRTWNEQVFEHPLSLGAGEEVGSALPLHSGAVLAAGFRWTADGTTADATPSEHGGDKRTNALSVGGVSKHATAVPGPTSVNDPSPADPSPADPSPAHPSPVASAQTPVPESPSTRSGLPDTRMEPIDDSFEHLFESTVMRSVEDAAVRTPPEELLMLPAAPATTSGTPAGAVEKAAAAFDPASAGSDPVSAVPDLQNRPGDHDGSTIMAGELAVLRGSTGDPIPVTSTTPTTGTPTTGTPTTSARQGAPAPADRWLLLQFSTGQSVEVDRSVVIGRRPQVDRVSGTDIPHLVTVPSPQQDISRSHVAVRPTATGCVAVDLGSTNGSVIRRAAGGSAVLAQGGILDLQPGDTIDLGDGVTATLRAPS
ncbi:FHA domain-containing protein [Nakamurella sp. PAMC28650]|uniref:FHA domain-containing protein n=1 Tax=Nakamurella sp. PAMC28650 TaxID=2762325 RepID=UPI00164E969B|nr:FHA domain-containing protein [Nakamurella sp. PAMC28650]QNK83094.1 FHA domain-containing protein [Nakamurella sp. PAMC28650]